MNFKRKEKYRSFWDEDQKFDFPRIIETKQLENKNDIVQRVADGKLDFENLAHSSFNENAKNDFVRCVTKNKEFELTYNINGRNLL